MYLLFIILFLLAPGATSADQFNDLYYVEPQATPDLTEEGKQSGSGSGQGQSNPPPAQGSSPGSENGKDDDDADSSGAGAGTGEQGEPGIDTEEEAVESLIEDGAVSGAGVEEKETSKGFGNFFGGAVTVSGAKVRAMLRSNPDIDEVLRFWKIGKSRKNPEGKTSKDRLTPGEYYALIAATLAADDEQLEEASFADGNFEIVYRSRGALFWFIPMSFPVRLTVVPTASLGERVSVRLPWYRFFVREYFTPRSLASEVEEVVTAELAKPDTDGDKEERIFNAVAQFLRQKVQTISNSIFVG